MSDIEQDTKRTQNDQISFDHPLVIQSPHAHTNENQGEEKSQATAFDIRSPNNSKVLPENINFQI